MQIYNTTFAVDKALEEEFLGWLREEFIPTTADKEYFHTNELLRVRQGADPEASTFALHLRAETDDDVERWYADYGSRLFADLLDRWNGRVVFFSTTLDCVD